MLNRHARLKEIDEVIQCGKYKDNWDSLAGREMPQWMYNGKMGIFIHWGVYSVPAFGSEWYSRNMYVKDCKEYQHHIETYGKHHFMIGSYGKDTKAKLEEFYSKAKDNADVVRAELIKQLQAFLDSKKQ